MIIISDESESEMIVIRSVVIDVAYKMEPRIGIIYICIQEFLKPLHIKRVLKYNFLQ